MSLPGDKIKKDERLEKILDLLLQYTLANYRRRELISNKGDEIDAIIIGLNSLGEELQSAGIIVRDYKERMDAIMNLLLKYTLGDFSQKLQVSGMDDELDAITIGLNTMAEELESSKQAQNEQLKRIEAANSFLDAILENIPNMVFVKDAKELRFVRFNKAGEDLLGYNRKDLIGKNDHDLFPKEQAEFFIAKDREALNKGTVTDIPEEPIETISGKRWLHTRKLPIIGTDGKPAYLLGISEDITEQKAAAEEIKKLNTDLQRNILRLEETNKELEAFTYSVSHDLRAPLRAIHGYTKILEEEYAEKLDSNAKRMMDSVMHNAKKMGQLIDDLLALSRLGKKELVKKEVDLTDLMNQSLNELNKIIDTSKAKITIDTLGSAMVDPALMHQVFINLLSNAIKYSSLKERPAVSVGAKKEKDETIYFIKDNGTGFDMKYYNKLFGVFQRLHDSYEFEGTGVGLALVKRIITRHGGKIWAEAEVDKGAIFYFTLNNL